MMKNRKWILRIMLLLLAFLLVTVLVQCQTKVFVNISSGTLTTGYGEVWNPVLKGTFLACVDLIEAGEYEEMEPIKATGMELLFYGGFMGGSRNFTILDGKTLEGNTYTLNDGKLYCNFRETSDFRRVYTDIPLALLKTLEWCLDCYDSNQ